MDRSIKFIDKVLEATGFQMVNENKVERAVYGDPTNKGLEGGVGEDADAETILAKYDQLHGFIKKGGYKVKHGTFFDPNVKRPAVKAVTPTKIVVLVKMNGEYVEHELGTEETLEMKIAKEQIEKSEEVIKKVGKKKGKK